MGSQTLLALAVAAAFALAAFPLLALLRTSRARIALAAVGLWAVAAASLAYASARFYPPLVPEREIADRPVQDLRSGYASSKACQSCHPEQYDTWHSSYHRTMTQVATPENVAGDFADVTVAFHGNSYQLERRGDELWVSMDDPAWTGTTPPRIERRIVLTTGSHHDQNYWYATPTGGRDLRLLPLAWRVQERKWVPFTSSFLLPPNAEFVYSQSNWTQTCIKCHATFGKQDVDAITEQIDSRVAEFGIACEACHGPGAEHIAANRDPQRRYRLHLGDGGDDTIVQPGKLVTARSAEVCGQCHGQWSERWQGIDLMDTPERYQPGEVLERNRIYQQFAAADPRYAQIDPQKQALMKMLLEQAPDDLGRSFWSDGEIRVSGREYTGLIDSPCYVGGEYSCVSCHKMHQTADDPRPRAEWANDQLTPGMEGNGACLQCHAAFASPAALTAHTHHAPESSGSTCYNCHMPFTNYGILKAHRSHTISSPSVQRSVATGRPNACNACHLDQTYAWTAEQLAARYGIASPELGDDERTTAASVLWALRGDAGQRILAAWYMGWQPAIDAASSSWMIPYLGELMTDPYDAVRFVAGRSLRRHPGYEDVAYDYVADRTQIAAATADVARRWSSMPRHAHGSAVLQQGDGALDAERYERLLGERNQRRVQLDE